MGAIEPLPHPGAEDDWDITWTRLFAMRRTVEAGQDPEWVARYGEQAFRACLQVIGGLGEYLEMIGEAACPASPDDGPGPLG